LEKEGNLQTDAAQLFLFVPIPAKAKKLGLLSIYKFSLIRIIPLLVFQSPILWSPDLQCVAGSVASPGASKENLNITLFSILFITVKSE
jgi:hypothetical protein